MKYVVLTNYEEKWVNIKDTYFDIFENYEDAKKCFDKQVEEFKQDAESKIIDEYGSLEELFGDYDSYIDIEEEDEFETNDNFLDYKIRIEILKK